jgi:carbonic anhydrase
MKRCARGLFSLLVLTTAGCQRHPSSAAPPVGAPSAARSVHWTYEGAEGPAHWAELSPQYEACRGARQSPVDIIGTRLAEGMSQWRVNYSTSSLRIAHHEHVTDIIDNGHTIQVTVDAGSRLTTPSGDYELRQFHFHTPSEHTLDGRQTPMEMHFVHQDAQGDFAVISALFVEGAANPNLAQLIEHLPAKKGDAHHLPAVRIDLSLHIPADSAGYRYAGSLTTPPCLESVEWLVLRHAITASGDQLRAFAERLGHNNRPVQPLHERMLTAAAVAGPTGD